MKTLLAVLFVLFPAVSWASGPTLGNPAYNSVTLTVPLAVTSGGTGASTASVARSGLGAAPDPSTATGSNNSRYLQDREADVVNVKDFGALPNGSDISANVNAAISYAASHNIPTVYIPAGTYYLNLSNSALNATTNITIKGDGPNSTTIVCDDTNSSPAIACIDNPNSNTITNFQIRDLTFQGKANIVSGNGSYGVLIYYCNNCSAENVQTIYIRGMGISFRHSNQITVSHCSVSNNNSDGIAVWNTPNAIITDNDIFGNNDDSISAHSEDTDSAPVRSGILITNNTIEYGQGIKVLGGKAVVVSNNVLRRIMAEGIEVDAGAGFSQGDTPNFSIEIKNNIIEDVFQRQDGGAQNVDYIVIGGGPKGSSGLVPTLGASNGVGALYMNNTISSTTTPGGGWVDISGNQLVRTLPAITSISQWGYGSYLWSTFSSNNEYTGAIPESALEGTGIVIVSPIRNSRICDNTISTTGTGITMNPTNSLDYDDVLICRNNISKFTSSGLAGFGGSTTSQRVVITDNIFDGDPSFLSSNRGSNGTWATNGYPVGIDFNFSGVVISRNSFRDMVSPLYNASGLAWTIDQDNIQYGNPIGGNSFSTSNVGLGSFLNGAGYIIQEDDNPNSTTFGQQLSASLYNPQINNLTASSVSSTNIYSGSVGNPGSVSSITLNLNSGPIYGFWLGSSLGGQLPLVVISPSNGAGGGATATLTGGIVLNTALAVSGGVGCSVNDTFKLFDPQSGGNLVGGGYVIITATAVSGGSVTASNFSASTGNSYYWNKPASSSTTLSAISSTCTTLPSLVGGWSNIQWSLTNNGSSLHSSVTLNNGGSGYTELPTVTLSPVYTSGSSVGEFTTALSSSMQFSTSAGNIQFVGSGTDLGITGAAGAPVVSTGALVDGSGIRYTLTTSGYTIPPNTSLVRFTQSSTIASATITLPTTEGTGLALQDGHPIQFDNYAGVVTALTFSPAVNGWTNGSTLAVYTGLRIRWDATAAAWYREQ